MGGIGAREGRVRDRKVTSNYEQQERREMGGVEGWKGIRAMIQTREKDSGGGGAWVGTVRD